MPRTAATVGNFDGCHLGHQALIQETVVAACSTGSLAVAMTFSPRPASFFRGQTSSPALFSDAQKVRALQELGINCVLVQKFDKEFSQLSREDFYRQVLREHLAVQHITVGRDFCFGQGRSGDATWLKVRSSENGISTVIGADVFDSGERISSTKIRNELSQKGNVDLAHRLLGRPYLIEGVIERGDQIGRSWGFPTANLGQVVQLVPLPGVYAGWVWLSERDPSSSTREPSIMTLPSARIPAVFSIGFRPTLNLPQPTLRIEAHLLNGVYGGSSLYGLRAGYYLLYRLREDRKFPDAQALREQIAQDVAEARAILSSLN